MLRAGSLLLRVPMPEDAEDALAMLRDREVARWNAAPAVVDLETARAWCGRGADWSSGTHVTFNVVSESGRLVGNVSLVDLDAANGVCNIGYRVAPWARRSGVATAAVTTVTMWAFETLGVERIQLFHAVDNVASCGVARAAGYELEGTLRSAHRYPDGARRDEHLHARLPTG